MEGRSGPGGLDGGDEDLFFRGQQGREQGGDLRRGPVAGHQGQLRHGPLSGFLSGHGRTGPAKELVDLRKGGCALADGLEFVAQQHEAGAGEVFFQDQQLGGRVVLDLVDHDIFGPHVLLPGEEHAQIEPLDGAEPFFAQQAAADAVDIEPLAGVDRVEGPAVLVLDAVVLGPGLGGDGPVGAHVGGVLAVLPLFVAFPAADLVLCQLLQIIDGDLDQTLASGDIFIGREHIRDPAGAEDLQAFLVDGTKVVRLQLQRGEPVLHLLQTLQEGPGGTGLAGEPVARDAGHGQKIVPGQGDGVHLAHVRQDLVDIAAEDGIERHQNDLVGAERVALAVEEPGDALQQDAGLAAAGDAVYQKDGDIFMADDGVLFLLDRCRDGLHLVAALPGQGPDQEGVLQRDLCVKISLQPVLLQLVLAPQQEVDIDPPPLHGVEGPAVVLVVVGLRNRGPPVDHQRLHRVLRDAGAADIVFLRLLIGLVAELHLGKVGGLEEALYPAELLGGGVPVDIVLVDGMVHDLELDIGFHGLRVPVEIEGQILPDVQLLCRSLFRDGTDPVLQVGLHILQLLICCGQVLLLLRENRILRRYVSCVLQRNLPSHWKLVIVSCAMIQNRFTYYKRCLSESPNMV